MYDTIITERNLRGDFRFNKEILIYLLEPCVFCFCFLFVFFLIIFKLVFSSTIYNDYFLDRITIINITFRPEIFNTVRICPRK